jgi:hypothetical protein
MLQRHFFLVAKYFGKYIQLMALKHVHMPSDLYAIFYSHLILGWSRPRQGPKSHDLLQYLQTGADSTQDT